MCTFTTTQTTYTNVNKKRPPTCIYIYTPYIQSSSARSLTLITSYFLSTYKSMLSTHLTNTLSPTVRRLMRAGWPGRQHPYVHGHTDAELWGGRRCRQAKVPGARGRSSRELLDGYVFCSTALYAVFYGPEELRLTLSRVPYTLHRSI